jgi:hypothetical protein
VSREKVLEALSWRMGVIRRSPQGVRSGRLQDAKTGEEFTFRSKDIITKGYTPGKKHKVLFKAGEDIDGRRILLIKKKS